MLDDSSRVGASAHEDDDGFVLAHGLAIMVAAELKR
jgi:hypothetical protein